MLYLKHVDI